MKIEDYVDFRLNKIKKEMPDQIKYIMLDSIYDFLTKHGWGTKQAHDLIQKRIIRRLHVLKAQLEAIITDLRTFEQ